jgi:hypothetical protein
MQVKDYLQALSDDNKIRVEKIGSGNWYWSFPRDEKIATEAALAEAQEEYNKAAAVVADLQAKVDEAGAAREEDGEGLKASGMTRTPIRCSCKYLYDIGSDRKTLIARHEDLLKEVKDLRKDLVAYSEHNPVEMDKKTGEIEKYKAEAEAHTDHILSMESWLKQQIGGDKEQMDHIMRMCYGDEFDEEEGGLREVC